MYEGTEMESSAGINRKGKFSENSSSQFSSSEGKSVPRTTKRSSVYRTSSNPPPVSQSVSSRSVRNKEELEVFEEESDEDGEGKEGKKKNKMEKNVQVHQHYSRDVVTSPYHQPSAAFSGKSTTEQTTHPNFPVPATVSCKGTKKKTESKSKSNNVSTSFVAEFDDFSIGLASDLPSDMFDVEGNLLIGNIDHIRFGLEEEDFSSAEEQDGHTQATAVARDHYQHRQNNDANFPSGRKSLKRKGASHEGSSWPKAGSVSSQRRRRSRHHNQQQQGQLGEISFQNMPQYPVSLSNKFLPILTSCESPSKMKGRSASCNNAVIAPGVDRVTDEVGSLANSVSELDRRQGGKGGRRTLRKYSSEDLYHPLISKSNKSHNFSRRQCSSSNHSSSSGAHNNSSSGNFSPPSDHFRSPFAPFDRHHSSGGASGSSSSTITQHYYPEGGWGYVILVTCTICHVLTCGLQLSFGILWHAILDKFGSELHFISCWLGAVSLGISLLFSPVWVSICKKKSTRLSAVFGGLVASLGCLFTSFASQFHQTFISYGAFLGIGVGLTRDASSLMVGQYFKRKREIVEIIVVSGSGLGIIIMSISIHTAIGSLGWRLGLQAVTVSLILTFFLGTCYRSASLYHPQRRAILHLKNQKRKVKEKGKREDKPPFIDCSCLRSKTLRIIFMSSACTAFGIFTPLLTLAVQCSNQGFEDCSILLLHVYIGTSWVIGCCTLGLIVIQKSQDCRVSKQYLCQVASVICGISILALTAVKGTNGMVVFSWVYGASLGGYCYSLKVYTYERARARHFPRAWSFLQSSQAIPLFFGVPLTNFANETVGWKSGYYLSALAVFVGTACLFLTDVRRRKLSRRKSQNSSMKTCETTDGGTSSPKSKRLSFAFPVDQLPHQQQSKHDSDDEDEPGGPVDPSVMIKELTCISEEGLADVDFQDIYFDDWAEYIGECITSCNKVENCLVSEYDPDLAMIVERRARRWSAAKQNLAQQQQQTTQGNSLLNSATGRLALPGIGTVLEVPLLVAKRLHPNLGMRSQKYHHQHLVHQPHQGDEGNCGNGCSSANNSHNHHSSTSAECNFSRGGNCAGTSRSSEQSAASSSSRVYHHGKARINHPVSHFPAIDEDSV